MLEIKKLKVVFYKDEPLEKVVLNELDLTVEDHDFICILGSNGAGKSTLYNSIIGSVKYEGSILLDGKNLNNEKKYKRMKEIGIVYQDPLKGTAPNLTVYENMLLASKAKTFLKKGFKKAFEQKTINDLKKFNLNLENNLKSQCKDLSGGMRQALTLYMATMSNPKLLLLDEHTAALDPKAQEEIMDITNGIVNNKKITTLMITHNLKTALNYGNRLIILNQGKIVLDIAGEKKQQMTEEKLLQLYSEHFSDEMLLS